MSLDVYLECGHCNSSLFTANITHNLGMMAQAAGIYMHLWRPDEIGVTLASELIEPLTAGLTRLDADPKEYKEFNPENGWGDYDGLVRFVRAYRDACRDFPTAKVRASR